MAVKKGGLGKGLDSLISNSGSGRKSARTKAAVKVEKKVSPVEEKKAEEKTSPVEEKEFEEGTAPVEEKKFEERVALIEEKRPEGKESLDLERIDQMLAALDKKSDLENRESDKKENTEETVVFAEAAIDSEKAVEHSQGSHFLRISEVEPNREQPRKTFDEDALIELSESIRQYGIIQPIIVQKKKDYYEIIAGERRWRAAKLAGLKEVPVVIRSYTDQEVVEISLIENIQRENLNPIEEAKAYKRLMDEFYLKQDEIAEKVSKSRTTITNSIRLLKLCEKVRRMLIDEMLSTGHARALLAIEDPELQYNIALRVFDEKLSVRETEGLVKSLGETRKKKEKVRTDPGEALVYKSLEDKLKEIVGTKVSIQRKSRDRGKIEIEYYSADELDRIIDLFNFMKGH